MFKQEVRKKILKTRYALSSKEYVYYNQQYKQKFSKFFQEYLKIHKPKIIGGYYPIHNEMNVLPILDRCREMGFVTALPFCHGKNTELTFHLFNGDENLLKPDVYQIKAPDSALPIIIPDLIICPALAICRITKKRLGYGGGFFDRYAALNPTIHFVAGFCDYQYVDNPKCFDLHDLTFYDYFGL